MSDQPQRPVILFRAVVDGLPALPDPTLQRGTFCVVREVDGSLHAFAVLETVGGQHWDILAGAGVVGASNVMQFDVTTAATSDSVHSIPAGAVVLYRSVNVTEVFDPGTTIDLGNSAAVDLLIDNGSIQPTIVDNYSAQDPVAWGGTARKARATVGGAPAAGAAVATILFAIPLN